MCVLSCVCRMCVSSVCVCACVCVYVRVYDISDNLLLFELKFIYSVTLAPKVA